MIDFAPTDSDDALFLALAQRIANGALADLNVGEVYLVHIDNWFDFKWLGWRSRGKKHQLVELRVPLFTLNRVRSQKHYVWDADKSCWSCTGSGKALHCAQPGRTHLAVPLDRISPSAAFIWYSGNTHTNKAGSLMMYASCADDYAWYVALSRNEQWKIHRETRITRRQLSCFEKRGRQLESIQA